MSLCQHSSLIRSDLVCRITVGDDSICTDDDCVDGLMLKEGTDHGVACGVTKRGRGMRAFEGSEAGWSEEEMSERLCPFNVSVTRDVLGEESDTHKSYKPESAVSTTPNSSISIPDDTL